MHCAWNESKIGGEIVAAVDINTVANEVYKYNFPFTNLINKNIQSLSAKTLNRFNINTILMSPPCQPFTRNGNYLDENDPRTNSFLYLIDILDKFEKLEYILMENVKGFECSSVRKLFVDKLKECKFEFQEFLVCPSSIGVPNSRLRYYCLARKTAASWNFKRKDEIMSMIPVDYGIPNTLESIIEKDVSDKYLINEKLLRHGNIMDICFKDSIRSCCFTKAYTHYIEGTGSVFTAATPETVKMCFEKANSFDVGSEKYVESLKKLNLRFFTPKEVSLLMSFPIYYKFPETVTLKQSYRLLGNSINVKVVSELLKLLFN
ncbi:unnamed protein product [Parnassius apollo]|uniref:tRNA (cytosine(38)-C(5))-methyltransferase n=1 Tax=Parnassius apollo TaxID=110799 RepID=A0A8S3W8D4_PARAO|nr:unnamed protein product [Parnassius apollo]